MYRFKIENVGKNKRVTLFEDKKFCSVYVARPDEFSEIPELRTRMVKLHRNKVKRRGF